MRLIFAQFFMMSLVMWPVKGRAEAEDSAAQVAGEQVEAQAGDEDREDATKSEEMGSFGFGSYGRVGVGSDLRGSTPEQVNVVAHGSRIAEPSYLELDMYYRLTTQTGIKIRTVSTLAFDGTLFHYTGEFDAKPALRNLFAEAKLPNGLGLWIGSRSYRGDGIYLLDYWPLDDINTLGAGASFGRGPWQLQVHAGANRLLTPFQHQMRDLTDPDFGAQSVVQLDRQRLIASTKLSYNFLANMKASLYGEVQRLPEGTRIREDESEEELAKDRGYSVGAQVAAWGFGEEGSVSLFARYSSGLTAYDELVAPMAVGPSRSTVGASEFVAAATSHYKRNRASIMAAGYARRFIDADKNSEDRDDGWEYMAAVRPQFRIASHVDASLDLSYQVRFPRGISPIAGIAIDPAVTSLAPMLLYTPGSGGLYDRPQLRLLYRAAHLNRGALDLYPTGDQRRNHPWVHLLGVQAEWWFNSSYQ